MSVPHVPNIGTILAQRVGNRTGAIASITSNYGTGIKQMGYRSINSLLQIAGHALDKRNQLSH
ncbi:hypothetical protein ABFV80_001262 [Vandammella animalimorsus]|uniref:hypothetical protein n=1 Tax=Vandammella animalimorsus TaxID=2029117 RepID=UPI00325ABCF4